MSAIKPGSRVVVTGAASGLGLALVKQLAARGCKVLATDVASECPESLAGLVGVDYQQLDVTSDADWAKAHDRVFESWGGLEYLFNNAGVAAGGRIELTEIDQWQWIMDINVLGVARGCRTFTPMMKNQRSGHIVNTASAAGLVHPPTMTEYVATKAAVVAISESLSHELKPFGVKVSVICPSFFRTNLADSLRGKDEQARASAEKLIGKARLGADEIATTVLKKVERGTHIVIPDLEAKVGYYAKRFARPVYTFAMGQAARQMTKKS